MGACSVHTICVVATPPCAPASGNGGRVCVSAAQSSPATHRGGALERLRPSPSPRAPPPAQIQVDATICRGCHPVPTAGKD